ncbi:MAG: P1 family peptidase [Candidatus Goldiibacteriota bacterium]
MKIALVYNLRKDDSEKTAETLKSKDVEKLHNAIMSLGHEVEPIEASQDPTLFVKLVFDFAPDLIFNVAEGVEGEAREAFFPGLFSQMNIPYTGGNASLLFVNLNKQLSKIILEEYGILTPKGAVITPENRELPKEIGFPAILKPNAEGSSKGISDDSVVKDADEYEKKIKKFLDKYPAGVLVEQYIKGREISVPFLEAFPGKVLEIIEYEMKSKGGSKYNIFDYEAKQSSLADVADVKCPPEFKEEERSMVMNMVKKVLSITKCPDFGRVDIRIDEKGYPYFIELNPLPSLHVNGSLMLCAKARGLSYEDVIKLVIRSASENYRLPMEKTENEKKKEMIADGRRMSARELGILIGRFKTGLNNNITDVEGVKVGHVTKIEDGVIVPGTDKKSSVRAGVTAIVPAEGDMMNKKLAAGGFVLNGIGELAGFHQVIEWGWLESPVFLSNTISLGKVHQAAVDYMLEKYPSASGGQRGVLPVVGETDDSFLNDIRIPSIDVKDILDAVQYASSGEIPQGSVGAGTGMITMDFAGGIGSSSRVVEVDGTPYNIGVLVLSNFGRMKNLTIEGAVAGRELDALYPYDIRRHNSYGSIITVVATDAPLLSNQLTRLSKRAALGLGRAGSHAASTSGEIVVAFSTKTVLDVQDEKRNSVLRADFIGDTRISDMYEAVIEASHEAVLNAVFMSSGMTGKDGRIAPAIPYDEVMKILGKGK